MSSELKIKENRSLVDLCLDLAELDPEAEENKVLIKEKLKALGEKVSSYCYLNDFAKSQIEMLKKERDFLSRQINNYENLIESLKDRAIYVLETQGKKVLEGDNGHKIRMGESHAVRITNINDLPEYLTRTYPATREADKLAIKQILLKNKEVTGAVLVTNKTITFK
jgi:hypothetical protein